MARTGAMFSSERFGIVPDLITTAKSLGGGLPIGGVTGRADVMDAVHPGGLGGTFGGNPLSCAAALAVFELIESEGLLERARRIEGLVRPRLEALVGAGGPVGHVRGRGAMLAVEIVEPGGARPDPSATLGIAQECH